MRFLPLLFGVLMMSHVAANAQSGPEQDRPGARLHGRRRSHRTRSLTP